MENSNIIASELPQAKHAYHASGYTNGKIIWVILVSMLAGAVIAVLAPILYLLIMGLVIGFGAAFCNVCGLLIIILPLALAIPWVFGAGIGYIANLVNIGMQKATHNNSQTVRWFFLVFVILGILAVFGYIAFADTPLNELDMEDWVPIALIIYGALGTTIGMLVIGNEEPLPPFCEPCLEYMQKIQLLPVPVTNIHIAISALESREFAPVLNGETELSLAGLPQSSEAGQANLPGEPVTKTLQLTFYYCKSCMKTGVLEASYITEVTKMDGKKEKKETATQRFFSSMLTEEEVRQLLPIVEQRPA